MSRFNKNTLWFLLIIILGVGLDQLTKVWVVANLPFGQPIPVLGKLLQFRYIHNEGAAWSILDGKVNFLIILSSLIVIGVLVILWKTPKEHKLFRFCLSVLIAGALGNLIDRIRLGYVVDFLELPYWPIFNIADCLLVVSVVIICVLVLFEKKPEPLPKEQERIDE